jgi:hypothetical protein
MRYALSIGRHGVDHPLTQAFSRPRLVQALSVEAASTQAPWERRNIPVRSPPHAGIPKWVRPDQGDPVSGDGFSTCLSAKAVRIVPRKARGTLCHQ